MIWVFAIIFLTVVILFAYQLYRKSNDIRKSLQNVTRSRRLIFGVSGCLLSFGSAYAALTVASVVRDWEHPPILPLIGVLIFMVGFLVLQVAAMLAFVSIATESETTSESKRS